MARNEEGLTRREFEIMLEMYRGKTSAKALARHFGCSFNTIKRHMDSVAKKYDTVGRTAALFKFIKGL